MESYKEVILKEPAIEYLRKHLSYGNTLSHFVLEKVDLTDGYITTGLPHNANMDIVNDYEYGGILPHKASSQQPNSPGENESKLSFEPVPTFFTYINDIIMSFINSNIYGLCLFENANAKPDDPIVSKYHSTLWRFGNEIYHILGSANVTPEEIKCTIKESHSLWTFIGFMTSLPRINQTPLTFRELSSQELRSLAEKTEKIIVGAYDGEGFLIWHKKIKN